jgi:NitT/TauT family transport system substrate-binding protein
MMNKHYYLWVTVALVFVFVAGACAGPTKEAPLPDIGPIKVGYGPIIGYAPLFVAYEKGYFAEQGLQVELENLSGQTGFLPAMSAGELDAHGLGVSVGLFNGIHQGLDFKVVSALGSEPPGYNGVPMLVRKDLFDSGEITEPADLEGRKVAVAFLRGIQEFLVSEVLAKADLTVDDVELVAIPFPDMPAAFANKAVDAACLPFPLAGQALSEGFAVVLIPGDEVTYWPTNGVIGFGSRFLDPANREAAVRFMVAFLKASRDVYGDGWTSDENAAIVSQYTNVPVSVIKQGASFYFEPNGRIYRPGVEKVQAYFVNRGYVDFSEPLPLDQVIDESFLEEALERIGEVEAEFEHD